MDSTAPVPAWIITGPTSGIGRRTALNLTRHGTVVLVGRDPARLREVEAEIAAQPGGRAGIMTSRPGRSPQGWDLAFATNHLGPFAFTAARRPAVVAGFRGGRYLSAEASARGEWQPGGSSHAGLDAYAPSKQGNLAAVFTFAREFPRLRFNGVEPGFNPGTGLSRDARPALQFLARYVLAPLAPLIKYWSTPRHAARVLTSVLTGDNDSTGVYYDENGKPMKASAQVSEPAFADRYVAETRALLATLPAGAAPANRATRGEQ